MKNHDDALYKRNQDERIDEYDVLVAECHIMVREKHHEKQH